MTRLKLFPGSLAKNKLSIAAWIGPSHIQEIAIVNRVHDSIRPALVFGPTYGHESRGHDHW